VGGIHLGLVGGSHLELVGGSPLELEGGSLLVLGGGTRLGLADTPLVVVVLHTVGLAVENRKGLQQLEWPQLVGRTAARK
jgi:hypothetical protein